MKKAKMKMEQTKSCSLKLATESSVSKLERGTIGDLDGVC